MGWSLRGGASSLSEDSMDDLALLRLIGVDSITSWMEAFSDRPSHHSSDYTPRSHPNQHHRWWIGAH